MFLTNLEQYLRWLTKLDLTLPFSSFQKIRNVACDRSLVDTENETEKYSLCLFWFTVGYQGKG